MGTTMARPLHQRYGKSFENVIETMPLHERKGLREGLQKQEALLVELEASLKICIESLYEEQQLTEKQEDLLACRRTAYLKSLGRTSAICHDEDSSDLDGETNATVGQSSTHAMDTSRGWQDKEMEGFEAIELKDTADDLRKSQMLKFLEEELPEIEKRISRRSMRQSSLAEEYEDQLDCTSEQIKAVRDRLGVLQETLPAEVESRV